MLNNSQDPLANVDFSDLFGDNQENLSMDRVERFLNKVINVASEKSKTDPNNLVRVVHGRKVVWMTQDQASRVLADDSEANLQQDVERALRGDMKYLRQELEILLALAYYTYNQYASLQAVSKKTLDHIEPSLQRRKHEINDGIAQTSESEKTLEEKRSQYPLLNEYEKLMGDFLNVKSSGDLQKAKELAQLLSEKKQKYLLLSRAIEPDVRTIYYHRLNLQKTKKRILNTQNELLSSRMDELLFEMNEIKKSLSDIKQEISDVEDEATGQTAISVDEMEGVHLSEKSSGASSGKSKVEEIKKDYAKKSTELNALNQESKLVQRHENNVNQVINHIAENVLQDSEHKVDVKSTFRSSPKKIDTSPAGGQKPSKSKHSGMYAGKRRE